MTDLLTPQERRFVEEWRKSAGGFELQPEAISLLKIIDRLAPSGAKGDASARPGHAVRVGIND